MWLHISQLFPQRHPKYPEIRIVYHYGERFYSASAVDAILSRKSSTTTTTTTTTTTGTSGAVETTGTTTLENEEEQSKSVADSSSPRSVISESKHAGQNPGSRSIGKRNQQFYLPDGSVKLMHISVEDRDRTDGEHDEGSDKWYGRYEKEKNTIMRTSTEYDLPESVDICEYETLAHFAQEHDKQCWGNDYTPSNTHNVWKNPHYMYYNTVTLKWEPLARLR